MHDVFLDSRARKQPGLSYTRGLLLEDDRGRCFRSERRRLSSLHQDLYVVKPNDSWLAIKVILTAVALYKGYSRIANTYIANKARLLCSSSVHLMTHWVVDRTSLLSSPSAGSAESFHIRPLEGTIPYEIYFCEKCLPTGLLKCATGQRRFPPVK